MKNKDSQLEKNLSHNDKILSNDMFNNILSQFNSMNRKIDDLTSIVNKKTCSNTILKTELETYKKLNDENTNTQILKQNEFEMKLNNLK